MGLLIFVLAVVYPSGDEDWTVIASQLTPQECKHLLQAYPDPWYAQGTTYLFTCETEDHD